MNNFEHEVLQQVNNDVLDNKMVNTSETPITLILGMNETENEHKIKTGEMTPFGSIDISNEKSKRYFVVLYTIKI